MGEWSDYFEDFPEEAPQSSTPHEKVKEQREKALQSMNAEAFALIAKARQKQIEADEAAKKPYLESVELCPQCGENALNLYKLKNSAYLCECQDCGIYGKGEDSSLALQDTIAAIAEERDWRVSSLFIE